MNYPGLRFSLCLLLVSALVPNQTVANQSNAGIMTLNEFLQLIQKNDPEYKKLLVEQEKTSFLIDGSLPRDALLFKFSSEYGFGNDDIDTRSVSASVSKEIFDTGSKLSASHSTLENTDRNEELTVFSIEQPLIKNAFGRDGALKKKALTTREQLALLQVMENYESYVNSKAKLYLDFSQAAMEVKLSESILAAAKTLYRHVDDKSRSNAANQTDVRRARLQVILREEDLLRKQENFEMLRKSILLSSHAINENIYPETDFNLSVMHQSKNDSEIESFVVEKFRKYQMVLLNKDAIYDEYQLAKRASKTELSLLGGYKIDQSTRFTSSVNREEAVIGLKLSVPFRDNQASAQASLVGLDLQQGELDQYQVERELNDTFQSLKAKLLLLEKEYALSKEKVEIMKAVLEEDTKRYNLGRIDTNRIIEVNNDFARYQFEQRQKLLELNKSYIDWLSLNDRLVLEPSVEFGLY
jgi:outer membrane protein TolC